MPKETEKEKVDLNTTKSYRKRKELEEAYGDLFKSYPHTSGAPMLFELPKSGKKAFRSEGIGWVRNESDPKKRVLRLRRERDENNGKKKTEK